MSSRNLQQQWIKCLIWNVSLSWPIYSPNRWGTTSLLLFVTLNAPGGSGYLVYSNTKEIIKYIITSKGRRPVILECHLHCVPCVLVYSLSWQLQKYFTSYDRRCLITVISVALCMYPVYSSRRLSVPWALFFIVSLTSNCHQYSG